MRLIFYFFLVVSVQFISKAAFSKELGCNFTGEEIKKKTYEMVTIKNDPEGALKILQGLKKCNNSDLQKAQIADYASQVFFALYKSTKKRTYAQQAEKLLSEAIFYNTKHNEVAFLHMALLMREMKLYEHAITYVNKALDMKPKEPLPALVMALRLAVDVENWEQAKTLVDILINKDKAYYVKSPPALLASVITLCYYNRISVARVFIKNAEKYSQKYDRYDKLYLEKSRTAVKKCEPAMK